jgi:hypothetical protein
MGGSGIIMPSARAGAGVKVKAEAKAKNKTKKVIRGRCIE